MDRAIIFGRAASTMSQVLIEAALRAAGPATGIEIVAVCDAEKKPAAAFPLRLARATVFNAVITTFDSERRGSRDGAVDAFREVRRRGIPVIVPPERNINHPDFIRYLREELRPTVGLTFCCLQILRRDLIGSFEVVANLHNGLLPDYRGVRTTEWSMFRGETETGFTYHHTNEGIDEGPVLIRDAIPIPPTGCHAELEAAKMAKAASRMSDFLQMLARREPGTPQAGSPGYYSTQDFLRARQAGDPRLKTSDDLRRALRCFDILHLTLGGATLPVTRLDVLRPGQLPHPTLGFVAADGVAMNATRFNYLPHALYRTVRGGR